MKTFASLAATLLLTFCLTTAKGQATKAMAEIKPLKDSGVSGTVTFTKEAGGLHVVAEIKGLTPGLHGFHIHENGDCTDPEGKSAGGHFNPMKMPHAGPNAEQRHAGDLGNLTADESGVAKLDVVDNHLALEGENSILNRSVIVHAKADDYKSQPAGESGARIACGTIKGELK